MNKGKFRKFLAGKGFYIALFLCVAAIGISGYMVLFSGRNSESEPSPLMDEGLDYTAPLPVTEPVIDEDAEYYLDLDRDSEPVMAVYPESEETEETTYGEEEVAETAAPLSEDTQTAAAEKGYVLPVEGTLAVGHSADTLVYNRTLGDWRTHTGIDLAAPEGTEVVAVFDGVVERVYQDDAFGNTVIVSHPDGMRSYYSSLAPEICVAEGSAVEGGEMLGSVGVSALSECGEEPHLHFAMTYEGTQIDPLDILNAN